MGPGGMMIVLQCSYPLSDTNALYVPSGHLSAESLVCSLHCSLFSRYLSESTWYQFWSIGDCTTAVQCPGVWTRNAVVFWGQLLVTYSYVLAVLS